MIEIYFDSTLDFNGRTIVKYKNKTYPFTYGTNLGSVIEDHLKGYHSIESYIAVDYL